MLVHLWKSLGIELDSTLILSTEYRFAILDFKDDQGRGSAAGFNFTNTKTVQHEILPDPRHGKIDVPAGGSQRHFMTRKQGFGD